MQSSKEKVETWIFTILTDESIKCELCGGRANFAIKTIWETVLHRCRKCFGKLILLLPRVEFKTPRGNPIYHQPIELERWETVAEANDINLAEAERIKAVVVEKLGGKPLDVRATFSNGRVERIVYYCNPIDVPPATEYHDDGSSETFFLKRVEAPLGWKRADDQ